MSCGKNSEPTVGVEDQLLDVVLFLIIADWYAPIKEYLLKGYFKDDIPEKERKRCTIKSRPYTFYGKKLYKLGPNGIFRQCFSPTKTNAILTEFHKGPVGGHYGISTIVKKILITSY